MLKSSTHTRRLHEPLLMCVPSYGKNSVILSRCFAFLSSIFTFMQRATCFGNIEEKICSWLSLWSYQHIIVKSTQGRSLRSQKHFAAVMRTPQQCLIGQFSLEVHFRTRRTDEGLRCCLCRSLSFSMRTCDLVAICLVMHLLSDALKAQSIIVV